MQRRKRHFRLRSITVTFGDYIQRFDYNINEKLKCSKEEKIRKLNDIQARLKEFDVQHDETYIDNQVQSDDQAILPIKKMIKKKDKKSSEDTNDEIIDNLLAKYIGSIPNDFFLTYEDFDLSFQNDDNNQFF